MTISEAARLGAKFALRLAQLGAMVAAAITLAAVPGITSAAASTLVETTNGWVQGKTVQSVDQWLGIRYAASPTGALRWAPPKPPGSYGTRQDSYNATQFGAPCPGGWWEERYGEGWVPYDSTEDNVQALTTPYPRPEFGFGTEHQCGFWGQLGLESGL